MDVEKFAEILMMVKDMDSQQRFTLFHEIEKTEDIIIPYYVSRVNLEEDMEDFIDDPKPVSDTEWEKFSKKIDEDGRILRIQFNELQYEILNEIRPNWRKES